MIYPQPLAIVIRFPNVVATRLELEAALQCQVARYERSGASNYAQLDPSETSDQWSAAIECIRAVSGRIERLVSEGAIGRHHWMSRSDFRSLPFQRRRQFQQASRRLLGAREWTSLFRCTELMRPMIEVA
jgi:hypothetical protein